MKKIIYVLLFFTTFLILKNVEAMSGFTDEEKVPNMYVSVSNTENTYEGQVNFITKYGKYYYSLNPYLPVNKDINYGEYNYVPKNVNVTNEQKERINIIAHYGYEYGNHTDIKWYGITQFLIWKELNPEIYFIDINGNRIDEYIKEIEELENLVERYYKLPSFANSYNIFDINSSYELVDENNVLSNFKIVSSDIDAIIDDNKLIINTTGDTYTEITFSNGNYDSAPPSIYYSEGYQPFFKKGQKEIINFSTKVNVMSGKITIIKKDSLNESSNFEGSEYGLYDKKGLVSIIKLDKLGMGCIDDLKLGEYYLKELKSSTGYKIDTNVYNVIVMSKMPYATLELYGEKVKSNVTITKYYGRKDNYKLENDAQFELYDSKDNLIGTYTTVNGKINFELPYGEYYLLQIRGESGYKFVDRTEIVINDDRDYNINLYNEEELYETSINKYYGENHEFEPEDGAEFKVYDSKDNLIGTYTTINGKIDLKLPYGDYYVIQTKGKEGYKKIDKTNFYIYDENPGSLYLYDKRIYSNVVLNKYYGEKDNYKLEDGAEFELYDENNNLLNTYSTVNGISLMVLPYGKYYLVQIKGKEGYKFIDKTEFTINEDKDYNINLYNDKIYNNVTITKYYGEKDNYKLEDGAEFKLYSKSKKLLGTYTTNNGIVNLNLPYGEYYITQSKGKEGYKFIEKTEIVINEDKDYNINLYNDKIYNNVTITKYYGEKDSYKLEDGAEFELYDENNNLLNTYSTVNGISLMVLPYGKYYLVQIKGKEGYKFIEKTEFTINEDKDYNINLYNDKIYNNVTITKYYGEKDNYKLEDGAEFKVYSKSKKLLGTYTTNNGIINLNLPYGEYYITQSKGIEGYKFIEKTEFTISEDKDYNINLYNDKIYSNVTINKYYGYDDNYELEDGAEFELYDEKDRLLEKYTTKKGVINISLPYGKYYLKQTKGKRGYKFVNDTKFEINEAKDYNINLYNDKIYNNVTINKYYGEKDDYKLESDAEFELYDEYNKLLGTYKTSRGKFKLNLSYGKYYLVQTKGKEGYKFIDKTEIIIDKEKDYNINLYNDRIYGNLIITKYYGEKDNYKLEDGAEFKVYSKSKKLLGTYTTNNGIINLNLPYGEYYITQSKGKEGYKFIDKTEFTINEAKDYNINLYNDKIYNNVTINKYYGEKDNYKLEDGAEFKIYNKSKKLLGTYTTNNGIINLNLPYGEYYITQSKGIEGYKFIDKTEFTINEAKDYNINLYNDKIHSNITINKYYGEKDNYKLENDAEFELYDEYNKLLGTYKTSRGKFKLNLSYGKYYLVQTKGKEGYKFIDKTEFIIREEKDYNINLYNNKIYVNLIITKYYGEKDNYKLEDGAEFKIYNKSKKLLGKYTTNNGIINLNLPYGEYYITQSKGKEGYKFIEKTEFTISEDKDYNINLYNDKIYSNVTINKYYGYDDNYELEDGAEFELYDEKDRLLEKYTTKKGVINISLPYGKYYLKQTKGKRGYKFVNDTKFEIKKEKEYVIDLYNKKITKKIEIKKYYGTDGKYKLENGAEFEVYNENDDLIGIYTTNKGIIKLELDYGNYYLKQTKGIENYKFADIINISIDDATINNDVIKVYDELDEGSVKGATLIVDVPNTNMEDNHNSLICIIIGILLIVIGYRKRTID